MRTDTRGLGDAGAETGGVQAQAKDCPGLAASTAVGTGEAGAARREASPAHTLISHLCPPEL